VKETTNIRKRGFASLSIEDRKRIASLGGKAAHAKGTAHQFTSEEAAEAGKRRGQPRSVRMQAKETASEQAKTM
jgi:general stress protein YciG